MITYFNDDSKFDPFIENCLNALIPDGLDNAGHIDIFYVDDLENNYAGLCDGDREYVNIILARNYYLADGDRIAFCSQELASNLAHELVHARQFLRGEINEYNYVWKGQDYENQNYEDWPWEVEAYSLEQPLVDLFWENV
tara:strand:- start:108 stop:527 length:420 start_codon:yes stop_codon:yes gene_type:complete